VGAINSAAQLLRIRELTAFGESEGATRYTSSCELPQKGYWFAPTVFADVAQSHRIAREEIFGPVLSVLTFRTPEEAVAKANNTNYGLACGIWSEKGSRTLWVAERSDESLWRHARVGVRARRWTARTGGVPQCLTLDWMSERRTNCSSTAPIPVRNRVEVTK
jgi:hypothetical protein